MFGSGIADYADNEMAEVHEHQNKRNDTVEGRDAVLVLVVERAVTKVPSTSIAANALFGKVHRVTLFELAAHIHRNLLLPTKQVLSEVYTSGCCGNRSAPLGWGRREHICIL